MSGYGLVLRMAVGRLEGHLGGFFKGWVYQSQSSSRSPARPPPPPIRDEANTLGIGIGWIPGHKWEVYGRTRASKLHKGLMGCNPTFPRMQLALPTCYRLSFPLGFPSLGFEGLGFPFPYSPLSFALGCGDLVAGTL